MSEISGFSLEIEISREISTHVLSTSRVHVQVRPVYRHPGRGERRPHESGPEELRHIPGALVALRIPAQPALTAQPVQPAQPA